MFVAVLQKVTGSYWGGHNPKDYWLGDWNNLLWSLCRHVPGLSAVSEELASGTRSRAYVISPRDPFL